jgi:hypothetical protein
LRSLLSIKLHLPIRHFWLNDLAKARIAVLEGSRKAVETSAEEKVQNLVQQLKTVKEATSVVLGAIREGGSELDRIQNHLRSEVKAREKTSKQDKGMDL